jgi:hypothetical protein
MFDGLADQSYSREFPGWAEAGGNSILVNGRPLAGEIAFDFAYPRPDQSTKVVSLRDFRLPGRRIRVTGALVLDCGHDEFDDGLYRRNPCWDDKNELDDISHQNQELHPVYAIDVMDATPNSNVTGVWGTDSGATVYLHRIGDELWALWLPPLRALREATIYNGTVRGDQVAVTWQSVVGDTASRGGAVLAIAADALTITVRYDNGSQDEWTKLFDAQDSTPSIGVRQRRSDLCADDFGVDGREGGTAHFDFWLSNLPPGQTVFPTHVPNAQVRQVTWDVAGATPGPNSDAVFVVTELPAAGTVITVTVTLTLQTGEVYRGSLAVKVERRLIYEEDLLRRFVCDLRAITLIRPPFTTAPWTIIPDPVPDEPIKVILRASTPIVRDVLEATENVRQLGLDLLRRL